MYSPWDNEVFPLPLRARDDDNDDQLVVLIPRILLDMLAPMLGVGYMHIITNASRACTPGSTPALYTASTLALYMPLYSSATSQRYIAALLDSATKQGYLLGYLQRYPV